MNKPPPPTFKKAYINLDSVFGHPYSHVTGEALTPNRVATVYLLRILFQTHFGHRHERSNYTAFDSEEKETVFHWLQTIMNSDENMTYDAYRSIIRKAFLANRDINYNFMTCMEEIACGEADVDLSVEDEFYTNKYAKDPSLEWNDPIHLIVEQETKDDMPFSTSYSSMYRWLKRVLAQYAKLSTMEMFQLTQMMRDWLNSTDTKFNGQLRGTNVPTEISCSSRAREWVAENSMYLHRNPHWAKSAHDIFAFTKQIHKRYPDIVEAHLIDSLVHVQLKDPYSATKSLKAFFELSMFELNGNLRHMARTHRLGVPSHIPLLYAPILQARISRIFGDFATARALLHEGLQQAQLRNNEIAHELANVEMHCVDIIGNGPILEDAAEKHRYEPEHDARIVRKALRHIDDLHGHSTAGPCCDLTEEDFELAAELDSYGKQLMILKQISESTFKLKYDRNAEVGFACPLGVDSMDRGTNVQAYGTSIIVGNLVRNGMYEQGRTIGCEYMTTCRKGKDHLAYLNETHAVIAINTAYAFAGLGDYWEAFKIIEKMKLKYPERICWMSFRHVMICEAVVMFDRFLLVNKYKRAKMFLKNLAQYSDAEYKLRQSLLLCCLGKKTEGILMLQNMNVFDVRLRIRAHMQLASSYIAFNILEKVPMELDKAMELAKTTTLKDVQVMIKRRRATMHMRRQEYKKCLEIIDEIADEMDTYGTCLEKICYLMTAAVSLRMLKKDPRPYLMEAKFLLNRKQWPGMEKMLLCELSILTKKNGPMENSWRYMAVCEEFGKEHADYPGKCDWLLM